MLSPPDPVRHCGRTDPVHSGVAVSRIAGVQFVAGPHPFNGAGNNLVQKIEDIVPGDPEEMSDTYFLQATEDVP